MKKFNFHNVAFMMMASMVTLSCSDDEPIEDGDIIAIAEIKAIDIEENILSFDSESTLASVLENNDEVELTVKDFAAKGFVSLRPYFDGFDDPKIDQFLSAKAERLSSKGALYTNKSKSATDVDIEDEIISDGKFASVLNENREIIVGKKYYIYTTDGVYFCDKNKKAKLTEYLLNLENSSGFVSKSMQSINTKNQNLSGKDEDDYVMNMSPVIGKIVKIDDNISTFRVEPDDPDFLPPSNPNPPKPPAPKPPAVKKTPILEAQNFPLAQYTENSLWQKWFGNAVDVNQYHDSEHRIKTKFWNQNYVIYSSIGAEARYQKKRLIGWSESDTSDGVRLGVNSVVYTYKNNYSPYNAIDPDRVILKYKGVSYDLSGKVVTQYPINPTVWPLTPTTTVGALEFTIFGKDVYWPLTGSEANKTINGLLKQARSVVPGLNADLENDKIRVDVTKFLPGSFQVTEADILKKGKSGVSDTFDFNFLAVWKSNSSGANFKTITDQLNGTKYSNIQIDMYGAALRNNVWLGTRIRGSAK